MKKAISYLLIFLGIQLLAGAIVTMAWNFFSGTTDESPGRLITTSVVVSCITIAVFLLTRWTAVSPTWLRTRQWDVMVWSSVAAFGAIIPSMWIQELMPPLPNIVEQEFDTILRNRWGYLAIGLLAPLSEEIVFRGAILRKMLDSPQMKPYTAIAVSAAMFALMHLNPAQLPHAFLIGLLLGWMYWRTGSILPGMVYHFVNNSIAYVTYNLYPDPDITLTDFFGSNSRVLMAVAFSILILLPAIYQLHLRMRRADE